ncbi:MAG: hypothetical protein IPI35_24450 [Deltaproteobacteria bacterium]|nr:hypothetical protein [Deltaproteobacteria bacterium]
MSLGRLAAPLGIFTLPALTACGGDLSNAVFVEDAAFRAALPQLAVSLAWPGGEVTVEEPATGAELLSLPPTQDALVELAAALDLLQVTVSPALSLSPSERGEDYRVWGPYPFEEAPGSFIRLEMSRTRDRALYSVALPGRRHEPRPVDGVRRGLVVRGALRGRPRRRARLGLGRVQRGHRSRGPRPLHLGLERRRRAPAPPPRRDRGARGGDDERVVG